MGSYLGWLRPIAAALVDMVEPAVSRFSRAQRWLAVEDDNENLTFYQTRGARTRLFGRGEVLDDRQRRVLSSRGIDDVELRLSADKLISTAIPLPTVGIDHIEQIIAHRLDRLTPWNPDQLLYGFASAAKAGMPEQIVVDFSATSHDIAANSIRRLEAFGLQPSRLGSAAEPIDSRLRIDLFRGRNDKARQRRRKIIFLVVAAIPVISIIAFLVTSYFLFESNQHLDDLDQRLATARQALANGSANPANRQRDLALMGAKTRDSAQFTLIDRLATIIPDTAFLEELNVDANGLRLVGSSTDASALIQILETDPRFAEASFVAPVTRQADGRDRFDLSASIVGSEMQVAP